MPMTITEKILAKASLKKKIFPGQNIWINVDSLMTHDVCAPGVFSIFKKNFGEHAKVFDKDRLILIPDHYIYTKDSYAQRNLDILRNFAKEHDITYFYDAFSSQYKGVCHVALAEEGHTVPGEILFGTDSHTCTAGAFGMFASGIGNTDGAFVLGTGRLWVKVPESMLFVFNGTFPKHTMAKDIILEIIGEIGVDGATYRSMEFSGEAIKNLPMEERMTLCNMAIEAGAKNGIIEADKVTFEFLKDIVKRPYEIFTSDSNAHYVYKKKYDASSFKSVVAKPHSPDNKAYAENLTEVRINRAYLGSCTGGKLTDFIAAAHILKGRKVVVDTHIVPATECVAKSLDTEKIDGQSLKDIFIQAGCSIGQATCGACLGGPEDTFARAQDHQIIISSTNRNFVGRMGSAKASIYLASPYTVAASALNGVITDPKIYLSK